MTSDNAGNVYVTGYFSGTADFDPSSGTANLTSAGSDDIFVAKYTDTGALVWARCMGGSTLDQGQAIAVDGSGNVYVSGYFNGTADFDPGSGTFNLTTASTQQSTFVTKLDSSGNFVWAAAFTGSGKNSGTALAVDNAGDVYIAGQFQGTVDFDPGSGTSNLSAPGSSNTDVFIVKLDSSAHLKWAGQIGGSSGDGVGGIALDATGNLYLSGTFWTTADLDPGPGTLNVTTNSSDAFVSKIDTSGNLIWARYWGGTAQVSSDAIALDAAGDIVTSGTFTGTTDFDPGSGTFNLTSSGSGFVSKLDSAGNFLWADALNVTIFALAVNPTGSVFLTGSLQGTADLDPGSGTFNLTSAGGQDIFDAKLDSSGAFVWATVTGGSGVDYATGIAVDPAGEVYTTGLFSSTVDFDPGPGTFNLTSSSGDAFVSQLLDPPDAQVNISQSGGSTDVAEGGNSDTYTVVLNTAPTANVTIAINPGNQLTVSPTSLVFTPANWNTPRTVTVSAIDDTILEGPHTGTITHTATSSDSSYNGLAIGNVVANITDNDGGLKLFQTWTFHGTYNALGTALRGQSSGSINFNGVPAGSTIVQAYMYWSYLDNTESPGLKNLFLNGSAVVGTLIGVGPGLDSDRQHSYAYRANITSLFTGNGTYFITGVASGGATLAEGVGIVFAFSNPSLPLKTVSLYDGVDLIGPTSYPTRSTTITGFTAAPAPTPAFTYIVADGQNLGDSAVASGSAGTVNLGQTFNGPWYDVDTFHPSGVVGPGSTSATAAITSGNDTLLWTAEVFEVNLPTAGVTVTESGGSTDVAEGGATDTYTDVLTTKPAANVTIAIKPDTQLTVSPTSLVFTPANWNIPQTVTVAAVDDNIVQGSRTGTILQTATSTDPNYNKVPVASVLPNITDNDVPHLIVRPDLLTILEGKTDDYTVALSNAPTADVTVTLAPDPQLTVSPSSLIFNASNWNQPQKVTVTAIDNSVNDGNRIVDVSHTVTSGDSQFAGIAVPDVAVDIIDDENTLFVNGGGINDQIGVLFSGSLIQVVLNRKATFYPNTYSQVVILAGAGNDSIQLTSPTIPVAVLGGDGNDKLELDGQVAANTFDITATSVTVNSQVVTFGDIENVVVAGKNAADTFKLETIPEYGLTLQGGGGVDQMIAPNQANTWNIGGPSSGTLDGKVLFSALESLTGGSGDDTFLFGAAKSIGGIVDGGGGNNTLDFSAYKTALTANLQTSTITGTKGFANIGTILGGAGIDKLIGPNATTTWNITGSNAGTVDGVSFSSFENLTGGSADDTFTFADGALLKGKIDGSTGTNTLDFSSVTGSVTVNLQMKSATNTAGWLNLQNFTGSQGTSTLIGANKVSTWTLNGAGSGTLTGGFTFQGFDNLTGGALADTFDATNGDWLGLLDGGAGLDTLLAPAGGTYTTTGLNAGTLNGRNFKAIESRK